jgi:hypothetical protein
MTVGDDALGPGPPDGVAATRRLWVAAVATVVATATAAGVILAVRGEPETPTGYDDDVAERFVEVCTADAADLGFAAPDAFCRCSYDRIASEVPFDRFVEIDARMGEDPGAVPDEIDRIRTECFAGATGEQVPNTAPTSTAPAGA